MDDDGRAGVRPAGPQRRPQPQPGAVLLRGHDVDGHLAGERRDETADRLDERRRGDHEHRVDDPRADERPDRAAHERDVPQRPQRGAARRREPVVVTHRDDAEHRPARLAHVSRAKTSRPLAVTSTLVTVAPTSVPIRSRAFSTTTIVPSSR